VLHDIFAVPFNEIAPIVGRSTQATKMLASRARHRVRAAELPDRDVATQRQVVDAFLAASRNGSFAALLDLLDPDVTFTIANGKIVAIDVLADAQHLGQLIIESASRPGGVHHASRP
jgi:hypothetical protein